MARNGGKAIWSRRATAMAALVFAFHAISADQGIWQEGPYPVGFRLVETLDETRFFPTRQKGRSDVRVIRMYLWYPAQKGTGAPLNLGAFVAMAQQDFVGQQELPVLLAQGMSAAPREALLKRATRSLQQAQPAPGHYPVIAVGQGLYYESPLSQLVLCELLAGHGYVVVTCPLQGTHTRLVNLSAEDLETQVRDLEIVMSRACNAWPTARIGVLGYDLGGMAGLVLTMRNPKVNAFVSMDSGILTAHPSGLPASHPSYDESRFVVPWMHLTQNRVIPSQSDPSFGHTLFDRKKFGDAFLVGVPTTNHGAFSAYATFGLEHRVPAYWQDIQDELADIHREVIARVVTFFDAYLKGDDAAKRELLKATGPFSPPAPAFTVSRKSGPSAPPSSAELIHAIIQDGFSKAKPKIDRTRIAHPDLVPIPERELNWLGYHFLYWWGRSKEAIDVLNLNVAWHPESANAYDSLAEAFAATGDIDEAIANYRKSIERDPSNAHAQRELERLSQGEDTAEEP